MNSRQAVKVMLLTNQLQDSPSGGRELLCKLNHDVLCKVCGDRLVLFELPHSRIIGLKLFINAFCGHIDGLNDAVITKTMQSIQADNIGKIFVDGSNLGGFVKVIKQKLPHVEIITFFHNVESKFFFGALRQSKTPRALAVLMINYLAERKSVRYSDKIISLSERDNRLLQRLYGRSATHISPMALQDKLPLSASPANGGGEKFALFVGGTFYANRAGISWFVEHVVPLINIKTYIVGRGFESHKVELERDSKVKVIGAVDNLAEWYLNAHFVIAPIFDGSGMKTKVAEALMFGKKVIGTPEAFSGYEEVADQAGWVCETAEEFAAAIELAQNKVILAHDPALRALYEKSYSFSAARNRFAAILGVPEKKYSRSFVND